MMPLRYDPYRIFQKSTTPAGLYARRKWLVHDDRFFREAFEETVDRLLSGQEASGAWNGSRHVTIQRLFGLHLTVRQATPTILKALAWLMERIPSSNDRLDRHVWDASTFENLPFVPSQPALYLRSAVLFLNTIFAQAETPAVCRMYAHLLQGLNPEVLLQEDPAGLSNALRALVVHPRFAVHPTVAQIVAGLAKRQTENGTWGANIPFFQVVNALAHLELPSADLQLESALAHLSHTQKADGTWGAKQIEWQTFLVVHALRNKGRLK